MIGPAGSVPGDQYSTLAASVAADLPKLVLKHEESFFVADQRGDFRDLPAGEYGFYLEGTRFLRRLELRVHDRWPLALNAAASEDTLQVAIDLTNPDVSEPGGSPLPGHTVRLARRLTLHENHLYQTLTIEGFAPEPHELALSWHFDADFADVFEVRGLRREQRGIALPVERESSVVRLAYRGLDGVVRTTHLRFEPAPREISDDGAHYQLQLAPGVCHELSVTISATTTSGPTPAVPGAGEAMVRRQTLRRRRAEEAASVRTNHEYVDKWVERARADLHMLLTDTPQGPVPYAGIPWYVAPFGRDSLIVALQLLPFEPEIARGTLRFLARHQGRVDEPFTDQEPGKILHEYRRGELAACREIVFLPYYGTVDATPLFVMLLAEYLRWTHDVALGRQLWPAVEQALGWMAATAEAGDGYLRYARRSPRGLANQGWKDSGDAVMHASGALAPAPIALVEAQTYWHAALLGAAHVAEVIGRRQVAPGLRTRAGRLRERFERDFWMEEEAFYALAIDGEGRPCRVITSNPGHGLWAGMVSEARAEVVAKRLMAGDMFTGWGVRTLSVRERRYNPMSYHNGSVWPHDTGIIAAGLRRYDLTEPFVTVATGLFEAVRRCDSLRMPELFCGFPRLPGYGPTRYPVACSPQAWAAGVVFQLIHAMLGLVPDAEANRLTLMRPILPPWLDWVELHGLRLRHSSVDLLVSRGRQGAAVEVVARRGDAEVVVRH